MSKNKEAHEKLIEVLKFTPRTYKISMWGYGGERVMGTVDPKIWDYCMDNCVDLTEIAWNDEDTVTEEMELDIDMLPFTPGSWYDCDDMGHVNGVSRNAGWIRIEDEKGDTVFEKSLEDCDGGEGSPGWCCCDEIWVGSRKKGEVVFIGSSNEKGTFFEGEINLREPFDIEKLELNYDEIDGEELVNSVYYDSEDIENYGGSTDGKSSDMTMVRLIDDDGNYERYEPGEKDWGHPEYGPSPSDWESSPKFKFKDNKPVHAGYYSCNYGHGSSYGSLYWNGEAFGEWEYGQFKPVNQDGVVSWQGYNWDTSDWSNQPPEPPGFICKKCKWVGSRDELREDEDFNTFCPECGSDKTDWIEYDPETAKGRKNREKYCIPAAPNPNDFTDLEEGLAELKAEYELLMADVPVKENDWIPAETTPKNKGEYEVEFNSTTWPWPVIQICEWTGRSWKDNGKKIDNIKQWREIAC